MTREELEMIPKMAREIEHERDKIEAMRSRLTSPKGLDTRDKVQTSGSEISLADVVIDAQQMLDKKEQKLRVYQDDARILIKHLEGEEWQLMTLRYVMALEWTDISRMMNYSPRTIYRMHNRALCALF